MQSIEITLDAIQNKLGDIFVVPIQIKDTNTIKTVKFCCRRQLTKNIQLTNNFVRTLQTNPIDANIWSSQRFQQINPYPYPLSEIEIFEQRRDTEFSDGVRCFNVFCKGVCKYGESKKNRSKYIVKISESQTTQ